MNRALQEYTSDFLPRATLSALQKIKDNSDRFKEIEELFTYTIHNGYDVLQSIHEYESSDGKSAKIEEALKSGSSTSLTNIWDENKKQLDESLVILQVLQRISHVSFFVFWKTLMVFVPSQSILRHISAYERTYRLMGIL